MAQSRLGCSGALLFCWLSLCAAFALLDTTTQDSTWIVLSVGGLVLFGLFRLQRRGRATVERGPVGVLKNYPGSYACEVAGESHYQDALEAAYGPRSEYGEGRQVVAHLVAEDDNPYDDNAVRVEVDGRTVGHLPREIAPQWRRAVREAGASEDIPVEVPAEIRGEDDSPAGAVPARSGRRERTETGPEPVRGAEELLREAEAPC